MLNIKDKKIISTETLFRVFTFAFKKSDKKQKQKKTDPPNDTIHMCFDVFKIKKSEHINT
jgi:hypothetical protein